ncbi:hypothetical protein, partial [Salibacterium salarium]|uniref:hypothetical protein n=1 Tax=Salibacterium salarium TaxID=284579 RepID=UPI00163B0BD4
VNRAQFATFLDRALEVQEPLAISNVSALTDDGHILEVEFNRPYTEDVDSSDVRIQETDSGQRVGVQDIQLSSDRQSAEITLYDNTSEDAEPEIERLTNYDLQIGDLETTFARPEYVDSDDGAYVSEVDADEREIEVLGKTLEVPEDMDFNFQEALGQELRVWYDGDDIVQNFEFQSDVVLDAVEVDGDEITAVGEDQNYDLAEDAEFIFNYGSDDEEVESGAEDIEDALDGNEYDYAKVILNDDGDVERVYAYTLNPEDSILVEEIDGNYIVDRNGDELDLEDYVIVKDGKEISIDDIEENDFVLFNSDAHGDGYAVVYNNTVSGNIDGVFQDSFDLDGENYDYIDGAQYLNEDNEKEPLDVDGAEKLEESGEEVTAYFNHEGEVILVAGTEGLVSSQFAPSYTVDSITAYKDNLDNDRLEIDVVNQDGDNELYDVSLDSLDEFFVQRNGEELEYEDGDDLPESISEDFEIDGFEIRDENGDEITDNNDFPTQNFTIYALSDNGDAPVEVVNIADEGKIVGLSTDDDGNLQGLEFYETTTTDQDIEYDDDYVDGKRLSDSAYVIGVDDELNGGYPDAEDVTIQTWDEIQDEGTDLDGSDVYYDEDDNVTHIYTEDFEAGDTSDHIALLTNVDVNTDNEIVRLEALVDGEKQTFDVDDLDNDYEEGEIVKLVVNENSDEVSEISSVDGTVIQDTVVDVDVSDRTVTLENEGEIELDANGEVYDASDEDSDDYSAESLRAIDEDDFVRVSLVESSSRFADVIAITNENNVNYSLNQDDADETLDQDYDSLSVNGDSTSLDLNNQTVGTLDVNGNDATISNGTVNNLNVSEDVDNLTLNDVSDGNGSEHTFNGGGSDSVELDADTDLSGDVTVAGNAVSFKGEGSLSGNVSIDTDSEVAFENDISNATVVIENENADVSVKAGVDVQIAQGVDRSNITVTEDGEDVDPEDLPEEGSDEETNSSEVTVDSVADLENNVSEVKLTFSEDLTVNQDTDEFTITDSEDNSISVTAGTYDDATEGEFKFANASSTVSVYVYGYNESGDDNPLTINFADNNYFEDTSNLEDTSVSVNVYTGEEVE